VQTCLLHGAGFRSVLLAPEFNKGGGVRSLTFTADGQYVRYKADPFDWLVFAPDGGPLAIGSFRAADDALRGDVSLLSTPSITDGKKRPPSGPAFRSLD